MQSPPQYPAMESYMLVKRDLIQHGIKVITYGVRPNLADLAGHPYETYVIFDMNGDYDCGTVHHRNWRDAIKYHKCAVNTLKEAVHA